MLQKIRFYISKGLRKYLNHPAVRDSSLHKTVVVWDNCSINNSIIGKYTYISDHTVISYTTVGAFSSVSSFCFIGGAGHPADFVSTSPVFLEGRNALKKHFAQLKYEPYKLTTIGNDVWIGTHCLIKSGVTIANGAIIGMGSVITKDIGPYEIWAGNPARFIRKRFNDETIIKLEESKWWDSSEEKLKEVAKFVSDPQAFLSALIKMNGIDHN